MTKIWCHLTIWLNNHVDLYNTHLYSSYLHHVHYIILNSFLFNIVEELM